MWVFVFFDLPTNTKKERREAAQFRKLLLRDGYIMLQFSVYGRPVQGVDGFQKHRKRLDSFAPKYGEVRILVITDHQFGKMERITNKESPYARRKKRAVQESSEPQLFL